MIGDKINIQPRHTRAAVAVHSLVAPSARGRTAIAIGGQSGAGKTEIAHELARMLDLAGIRATILQMDDYFRYPPRTNHRRRLEDITWVGTQEVDLALLDRHIAQYKSTSPPAIDKPLMVFEEDRATCERLDLTRFPVLIVEGTYATVLQNADVRVFIDRTYLDTVDDRRARGRDVVDAFSERVLAIENDIVSRHREFADIIVHKNFSATRVPRGTES